MKRSIFGLAAGIMATLMLSVGAQAATIWEPTDGDVNILVFAGDRPSLNGGTLAWFSSPADLAADMPAMVIGSSGGSFVPGPTFLLGVTWDGTDYFGDVIQLQSLGDPNSWLMFFADGTGNRGVVYAADLQPIPLPTAAVLFASALLGLVGVKRRKA